MSTVALVNGTIADGSGAEAVPGDLLFADGAIREVGSFAIPDCAEIVDCSGCVVAPGFIDAHSHSDLQVLEGRTEKLLQGVTSEVVGNCGFSAYPARQNAEALRDFANGILCGGDDWGWESAASYLASAQMLASATSVFSLIGHGSLRIAVAGNRMDPLSGQQLAAMEEMLAEALDQGAVGFSTGLMYAPGSGAPIEELERLCRVVERKGKIYCTHMRDYGFRLIEAIDEQIHLARATGCRLQISHLQAVGRANRDLNQRALDRIEQAHLHGIDIAFDCYPYIAGSTVMTQLLPQQALEGGIPALMRRLSTPGLRASLAEQTATGMAHDWSELLVSAVQSEANEGLIGKTLLEGAHERDTSPIDFMFDLILEEKGAVNILEFNQSEENLRVNLRHPLSIIISDGFYVKGRPHPRLHGTFPELLGLFCRERKWLDLPTAIHKVTGFPADRFGLSGKGYLRKGYQADVTVFDPLQVRSRATYQEPTLSPQGIRYVFKQGRMLLPECAPAK